MRTDAGTVLLEGGSASIPATGSAPETPSSRPELFTRPRPVLEADSCLVLGIITYGTASRHYSALAASATVHSGAVTHFIPSETSAQYVLV